MSSTLYFGLNRGPIDLSSIFGGADPEYDNDSDLKELVSMIDGGGKGVNTQTQISPMVTQILTDTIAQYNITKMNKKGKKGGIEHNSNLGGDSNVDSDSKSDSESTSGDDDSDDQVILPKEANIIIPCAIHINSGAEPNTESKAETEPKVEPSIVQNIEPTAEPSIVQNIEPTAEPSIVQNIEPKAEQKAEIDMIQNIEPKAEQKAEIDMTQNIEQKAESEADVVRDVEQKDKMEDVSAYVVITDPNAKIECGDITNMYGDTSTTSEVKTGAAEDGEMIGISDLIVHFIEGAGEKKRKVRFADELAATTDDYITVLGTELLQSGIDT